MMRKLLLAAAAGVGLAGPAVAQDVVIGAVLPLSGASATQGQDIYRGIEMAVDAVNAEGGVLGRPLRVIAEDSASRAATGLDAARKLVTVDQVPVIIGEFSSGVTIPIAEFITGEGVVQLNVASTSGLLRNFVGTGFFGLIGLDHVSGAFAADDVFEMGGRRAAVIAPNNAFGQGAAAEFNKRFAEIGGETTSTILYAEGQTTYRRELQQLEATDPDFYVYTAYGREAATINREAYELGINETPWYGMYLSMCVADTEPTYREGQFGFEVNFIGPDGAPYQEAYIERYGHDFVSSFNGYGYDAVMMAVAAMEQSGSTDPAEITVAMRDVGQGFPGVTGEITFDEFQVRGSQPYLALVIENDQFVER